jgi:hypothetical protein
MINVIRKWAEQRKREERFGDLRQHLAWALDNINEAAIDAAAMQASREDRVIGIAMAAKAAELRQMIEDHLDEYEEMIATEQPTFVLNREARNAA